MKCDDEEPTPELIAEAIAHATEFLFDACPGDATRIMRGPDGRYGAIFIIKNASDVADFVKFYAQKFSEEPSIACNAPPDYENN